MQSHARVIFFGSSVFSLPTLEALSKSEYRPVLVVTTPDAPTGRKQFLSPSPVKARARELTLEVFGPEALKDRATVERIAGYQPTVGVLAAYGKIIPKMILGLFPKGILNVHPSLLPRWRGPSPIQCALIAGDGKTGVTIMVLDEAIDHGPILTKAEVNISSIETYQSLHEQLAELGAQLLMKALPAWLANTVTPLRQDDSQVTYSKKFIHEDGRIDWQKSADEIARQVRALNPEPGVWTTFGVPSRILKILAAEPFSEVRGLQDRRIGEIFMWNQRLGVRCGKGALVVNMAQPEGKNPMNSEDFLRGHREIIGQVFT